MEHMMNMPTKKRRANLNIDWKQLIDECLTSGQKISEFCRERKIPESGFYMWRNRLFPKNKSISQKRQRNLFSPVQLDLPQNISRNLGSLILIYPNGCQLKISEPFDPVMIRTVNQLMGL